jgi:hypothetical protein
MSRIAVLLLLAACGAPARSSAEPAAATASGPAPSATAEDAGADVARANAAGADASPEPTAHGEGPSGGSVLVGEIMAPKTFKPGPTLAALVPDMVACYRKARGSVPSLRGKLKLRVVVSETGAAQAVAAEAGGGANDPALVSCLDEAFKGATFPKPGGTAILLVPLVFRP